MTNNYMCHECGQGKGLEAENAELRERVAELVLVIKEMVSEAYNAEKKVDMFKPNHQMGFIGFVIQNGQAALDKQALQKDGGE